MGESSLLKGRPTSLTDGSTVEGRSGKSNMLVVVISGGLSGKNTSYLGHPLADFYEYRYSVIAADESSYEVKYCPTPTNLSPFPFGNLIFCRIRTITKTDSNHHSEYRYARFVFHLSS